MPQMLFVRGAADYNSSWFGVTGVSGAAKPLRGMETPQKGKKWNGKSEGTPSIFAFAGSLMLTFTKIKWLLLSFKRKELQHNDAWLKNKSGKGQQKRAESVEKKREKCATSNTILRSTYISR